MSSWFPINKALINSIIDLGLPHPIIQENVSKKEIDVAQGEDFHLEVTSLPADTDPLTKAELDQYNGIFQISINGKLNKGTGTILALADTILNAYKTGQTYTNSGCEVEIDSSSMERPRPEGSFYVIDLSITWFAYIDR